MVELGPPLSFSATWDGNHKIQIKIMEVFSASLLIVGYDLLPSKFNVFTTFNSWVSVSHYVESPIFVQKLLIFDVCKFPT